ncbi:hypothetical protein LZ30DRAFT_306893 [Colletotrichum cereale]|nr:hypothetical protein LZ30DRAFT_306893 [Colletotrichum cereale]
MYCCLKWGSGVDWGETGICSSPSCVGCNARDKSTSLGLRSGVGEEAAAAMYSYNALSQPSRPSLCLRPQHVSPLPKGQDMAQPSPNWRRGRLTIERVQEPPQGGKAGVAAPGQCDTNMAPRSATAPIGHGAAIVPACRLWGDVDRYAGCNRHSPGAVT